MVNQRKIYAVEFTAIILLWTLVVVSPLLFMEDFTEDWRKVHIMWSECIVVGVVFLANRFALMPMLFFRRRYIAYVASVVALLAMLSIFIFYFDGVNMIVSLWGERDFFEPMPPLDMPPHFGFEPMPPMPAPSMNAIPPTVTVLIVSTLVMALDLGLRIASTWVITEQKQSEIDKQSALSQLQNLQSQVSPHFFMNTLNNIHALVDIDSARAKRTIIELSDLMSYLLYDCSNTDKILLQKELDFVENYINLMRLRFSSQVKINFSYDEDMPKVEIPPLLFLNFIENAFKHGVDYEQESIINIHFGFTDSAIEMKVLNSNHSANPNPKRHGGLGISNSQSRLNLIYGNRYTLDISEKEAIYFVNLKIPIQ
ncbi:MAG: histidine kinase [Rikenellaceae bacterium]